MTQTKAIIASFLIATALYIGVITTKLTSEEETEDAPPINALEPHNNAFSAIKAEASKRSNKRSYDALRAQSVAKHKAARLAREAELKRKQAAEELKRKQALAAERARVKPKLIAQAAPPAKAVSRSKPYVGQAQSFEATFYTAYCPTGCIGITASGYDVSNTIYYEGMRILAAPKSVPMYSIMRVTYANGTAFDGIVLDRGGDIGAGRLDILVGSRDEAYRLGRQTVKASYIRKGR
ncbi:3D (Asp-Asp-Asp) domain-containing protein [Sporosarcina phage Lietuvens]|nr:3D (Asp-Asp-Asp) domain-containing protein [Sporosarcina phage Lietuvens]